ncbi:MAG: hypothetical protein H6581_17730 [Bacteroidia bacterium]|nr:hypothetical protein [Bacteroidia bacterium]
MKLSQLLLYVLVFLPACLAAQAAPSPDDLVAKGFKRYSLESAVIEYNLSGSRAGRETLYFDHFGWRESLFSGFVCIPFGWQEEQSRQKTLLALIEFNLDLNEKKGTQMPNTQLLSQYQHATQKELYLADSLTLRSMGADFLGREKILGKKCLIFELKFLGTTLWIWDGIILKKKVHFAGESYLSEAISIRPGAKPDEAKFTIPEGIEMRYH